jgi:hypothetical protein
MLPTFARFIHVMIMLLYSQSLYEYGISRMIKAIFFDLDGTLRHSVPTGGDVFTDVCTQRLSGRENLR